MVVGIVSIAAVGVLGVAVALDNAGAGGGAGEAAGAGGELSRLLTSFLILFSAWNLRLERGKCQRCTGDLSGCVGRP